jgi:hypothetical protein
MLLDPVSVIWQLAQLPHRLESSSRVIVTHLIQQHTAGTVSMIDSDARG